MENLLNKLNSHTGELNVSLIIPTEPNTFVKEINQERVQSAIKEAVNSVLEHADRSFDDGLVMSNFDLKEGHTSRPLIEDAVNNIINPVKEKKGKIVFVGNNELLQYEKIAAFLRY